MNTSQLFDPDRRSKAPLVFILCLLVLIGAALLASKVQTNFGTVAVSNVSYLNYNGIRIRAKLLKPLSAAESHPAPGVVYILFLFAYLVEHTLESILLVDYRFIFPFASDLTAYRLKLWFTYFPLLAVGFLLMGVFLHGQLRRPPRSTWFRTFITWMFVSSQVIAPIPV